MVALVHGWRVGGRDEETDPRATAALEAPLRSPPRQQSLRIAGTLRLLVENTYIRPATAWSRPGAFPFFVATRSTHRAAVSRQAAARP